MWGTRKGSLRTRRDAAIVRRRDPLVQLPGLLQERTVTGEKQKQQQRWLPGLLSCYNRFSEPTLSLLCPLFPQFPHASLLQPRKHSTSWEFLVKACTTITVAVAGGLWPSEEARDAYPTGFFCIGSMHSSVTRKL